MFQRRAREKVRTVDLMAEEPEDETTDPPSPGSAGPAGAASAYVVHGDADPSILAAGHSHVLTLQSALFRGLGPKNHRVGVAYYARARRVPAETEYWDFVVHEAQDRVVAVSWSGNYHLADFLLAGDNPLHVYDAAGPPPTNIAAAASAADTAAAGDGAASDGIWVPQEMLRAHWRHAYAELDEVLPRLRARARRTVVLATPPPKRDDLARQALVREPFFAAQAAELGIAPESLRLTGERDRLAMWRVTQDLLRDRQVDHGAEFVPVPPQAVDADGFLRPEYAYHDVSHANAEYGALVWSALCAYLQEEVAV